MYMTKQNLKKEACTRNLDVHDKPELNPLEHSVVSDATGLATSAQYAVVCEMVETSMSFACNSSFLSVDGMTCLISSER